MNLKKSFMGVVLFSVAKMGGAHGPVRTDHTGGGARPWKAAAPPGYLRRVNDDEVLLLLGGNVGDVRATLAEAAVRIGDRVGTVRATSRDHWTAPWGFTDDRPFLNKALLVRTALQPAAVLAACLRIEEELGRVRDPHARYGPRTIDIDLLLQGARTITTPGLTLPHPRLHERAFALAPAADVAPGLVHPLLGRTLLRALDDLRHRGTA